MAMLVELLPCLISTYKGLKMHEVAVEESWDKITIKSYRFYDFCNTCEGKTLWIFFKWLTFFTSSNEMITNDIVKLIKLIPISYAALCK